MGALIFTVGFGGFVVVELYTNCCGFDVYIYSGGSVISQAIHVIPKQR